MHRVLYPRRAGRIPTDSQSLRLAHGLDSSVLDDIRAVGAVLGPRVPELIGDFYSWLMRLPEFAQFFSSGKLLTRVKGQQTDYWLDFLHAEIDEAYVERRRIIGQVHARIELGLLIYLQAMEFVSAWMRREIEANAQLLGEHPQALFAIRKLIKFDSAVVVDTYAKRTAHRLAEQQERLEHVAGVMRAVTEGDLGHLIAPSGPEDQLGQSLNDMVQSLRNIAREMDLIARGDYSAHIAPRSEKDALGTSLQAMTQALRDSAARNEQLMWMAKSQAELGQAMSGNPTVEELSSRVLT